nr:MAG: hypothetical protein DIU80_07315 [Chloroflexota bacterium]
MGPIPVRARLNLLFIADDDSLCKGLGGSAPIAGGKSFACRFLTDVSILYIDGGTAYLELTPYQAHALWSLQAAGVALVGERYGATSDPLAPLERLEAGQITYEELTAPAPTLTGARAPHVSEAGGQPADSANPATMEPAATPGGTPAEIPGSTLPIPGVQPTAAPAPTDPAAASENGTQP